MVSNSRYSTSLCRGQIHFREVDSIKRSSNTLYKEVKSILEYFKGPIPSFKDPSGSLFYMNSSSILEVKSNFEVKRLLKKNWSLLIGFDQHFVGPMVSIDTI